MALRQALLERLGLAARAREAVEDEAVRGLRRVELLQDHVADQLVRHQVAAVHVLLGLGPELGAVLHGGAQDVARRVVGQVEVVDEALGLGSLAGAGRSEQYRDSAQARGAVLSRRACVDGELLQAVGMDEGVPQRGFERRRRNRDPARAPRRVRARLPGPSLPDRRRPERPRARARRTSARPRRWASGWPREPLSRLFVTPLRRTQETAAPLAARLGLEPVVIPELREVGPRRAGRAANGASAPPTATRSWPASSPSSAGTWSRTPSPPRSSPRRVRPAWRAWSRPPARTSWSPRWPTAG